MPGVDPSAHLGLVYQIVGEMVRPGGAHLYEDLVQEGMVAMVEAATRYDPAHGATFASYAAVCIRGRVRCAVRDMLGAVRLPRYRWAMGERPAPSCSLEQPTIPEGDETTIPANRIADEHPAPDAEAEAAELAAATRARIEALPPRLREVMRARLIEGLTLEEVGELCGITKQAVQQREQKALLRLRLHRAGE